MVKNSNKKMFIRSILLFLVILTLFLVIFMRRADAASTQSNKTYISFEIKKGDNLSKIARLYNDRSIQSDNAYIETILDLNNMLDPDELKAGKHIVIPVYSNKL